MRMRLFQRLQQDALVLIAQPADVGDQRHPSRRHRRLQIEERLQRQLVELWRLVRQEPDLIDRQRFDAVVFPVVGVAGKRRLGQKRGGKGTRGDRLAQTRLPDKQIGVRQAVRVDLRPQLVERLRVAYNSAKGV